MSKEIITPKSKLSSVIRDFPELESILADISLEFAKLENLTLRNAVAQSTTLEQVAKISNIEISLLINNLRRIVGQNMIDFKNTDKNSNVEFEITNETIIKETIDARPIIASGGHPLQMVMQKINESDLGDIIKLITPFVPIPMIDVAKERGYIVRFNQISDNEVHTFFKK